MWSIAADVCVLVSGQALQFLVISDDVDVVSWINSCHLLNYLLRSEVS